jgi:hypothetical protein
MKIIEYNFCIHLLDYVAQLVAQLAAPQSQGYSGSVPARISAVPG